MLSAWFRSTRKSYLSSFLHGQINQLQIYLQHLFDMPLYITVHVKTKCTLVSASFQRTWYLGHCMVFTIYNYNIIVRVNCLRASALWNFIRFSQEIDCNSETYTIKSLADDCMNLSYGLPIKVYDFDVTYQSVIPEVYYRHVLMDFWSYRIVFNYPTLLYRYMHTSWQQLR
jgi:hypothetical protein